MICLVYIHISLDTISRVSFNFIFWPSLHRTNGIVLGHVLVGAFVFLEKRAPVSFQANDSVELARSWHGWSWWSCVPLSLSIDIYIYTYIHALYTLVLVFTYMKLFQRQQLLTLKGRNLVSAWHLGEVSWGVWEAHGETLEGALGPSGRGATLWDGVWVPSSFLFLVAMPGAPNSFLVTNSSALCS